MMRSINISVAFLKKKFIHYLGIILVLVFIFVSFNVSKIVQYNIAEDHMLTTREFFGDYDLEFFSKRNLSTEIKDENIKKIFSVGILGDIMVDNQSGNAYKSNLYTYDSNYLKENKYVLAEGRLPKYEGEILLEKKYSDKLSKKISLNNEIEFKNIYGKEYNKKNFCRRYKVVGLLKKNYSSDENIKIDKMMKSNAFVILNKHDIDKFENCEYINYISYNDGMSDIENKKKNLEGLHNQVYDIRESDMKKAKEQLDRAASIKSNIKEDLFSMLISMIFVICIYMLLESEIIRDIGMIRLIGLSRKGSNNILMKMYMMIATLSNLIGLLLSYIISYIILKYFKYTGYITYTNVFVQYKYALMSAFIVYLLIIFLNIYLIYKTRNMEIYEQINYNYTPKIFKGINNKNVVFKIFERNIYSNSIVFIAIISTAITGVMFVRTRGTGSGDMYNYSTYNNTYANNNYALKEDPDLIDPIINRIQLDKIRNLDGIENMLIRTYVNTYITEDTKKLTNEYISMENIKKMDRYINIDSTLELIDINKYTKSELSRFLYCGSLENIGKVDSDGYLNVAIMNSAMYGSVFYNIIKDLNIGDKIILNLIENTEKKQLKVKIVALISPGWRSMGLSSGTLKMEMISDLNSTSKLLNITDFEAARSGISFDISKTDLFIEKTIKKIKEKMMKEGIPFMVFRKDKEIESADRKFYDISTSMRIISLFIISGVSMGISIYSVFNNRKNNIKILIDLGMKRSSVLKCNIVETIFYTLIIAIIMLPIAIYEDYKFYSYIRDVIVANTGVKGLISKKYFPPVEIYAFLIYVLVINICFSILNTVKILKDNKVITLK